jgi:hypothetical protein
MSLDNPVVQDPAPESTLMVPIQETVVPTVTLSTPSRRCPACTIGLAGTNAGFLVPDHIQKKFADSWNVHVPLTFLTDNGCLLKTKQVVSVSHNILSINNSTGQLFTNPKLLSDNRELDLTFDKWYQAWCRLLRLFKTFLPKEFPLWEVHYTFILDRENCSELWPLYLVYDAEIQRRATQLAIDPSVFSIGIWNDLESRYSTNRVLTLAQSNSRFQPPSNNNNSTHLRNPSKGSSSQSHQPLICG